MTKKISILGMILSTILFSNCYSTQTDFPVLKGPYLGQRPPGLTPEVFAPGIISTGATEGASSFSIDGRFYFFARARAAQEGIFIMEQINGVWSKPRLAPFSVGKHDWDFMLAPDGKTVYVASGRPLRKGGSPLRDHRIWVSVRTEGGWSEPGLLPFPVNSGQHDSYPSVTKDGILYFFSRRDGGLGNGDIYRASKTNDQYTAVENLREPINTGHHEVDPYIAPDESYIIFCSDRPGGLGKEDFYVSYKKEDGSWSVPVNMGGRVNSPHQEYIPYVTPDGKYFFFTSNKSGNRDIYWMDAIIIEDLKQQDELSLLKGPYLGQKPPGLMPIIFAEGIVSTGASEFGSTFTPGGQEFCYAVSGIPRQVIVFMEFQENRWTQPQIPIFSGKYDNWDMNFSPDGKKLYFTSNRPLTGSGDPLDNSNLWVVEKTDIGWGESRDLGPLINTDGYENYPSVTNDGTLYYFHSEKRDDQNPDVYYSKLIDGKYSEPVKLGTEINSQYQEWDPFIAKDESYLIFGSLDRPGGFGGCDLYISFRREDGTWTQAVNMGESINTEANEFCPNVTSDGKYLFFTSRRRRLEGLLPTNPITYKEKMKMVNSPGNGEGDIYWVNAQVIDELKPDELK